MNNIDEEYIKEEVESRLLAEENGLYDNNNNCKMSWEQEMSLHQAMSTLSTLAKETNSSVSDLLKYNGYTIVQDNGYPMISNVIYKIVYSIQRAYSDYCVKYRRIPNQLMMHKSIASILWSELGEKEKTLVQKDNGFTFMGGVVIIIDDDDLFTDGQMFKWVSVSGINV